VPDTPPSLTMDDVALPEWLEPVRDAVETMTGEDLSAFTPPDDPTPREGAVLVLFGDGPEGPDILLTERAHTMRSQPGQVSFPGGASDDGEDAVATALREAEEETGLDPDGVGVFAVLPRIWLPPRNFAVAPVLAYWDHPSPIHVVNEREVHAVFRTPIEHMLDPAQRFCVKHPLGWHGPGWMVGPERDVLLWGFTAGIIDALFDHVGWTRDWDRGEVRTLPEEHVDWHRIADFLGVDTPEEVAELIRQGRLEGHETLDRDHASQESVDDNDTPEGTSVPIGNEDDGHGNPRRGNR
jgi:8-oxo-dGTP pyrophosphatase MutT (NUDIX family)